MSVTKHAWSTNEREIAPDLANQIYTTAILNSAELKAAKIAMNTFKGMTTQPYDASNDHQTL